MANSISHSDELLVEQHGPVVWIILNRPAALNSINPTMLAALHGAFESIQAGGSARVVVLTGAGDAFCVGSDLGVVAGAGNSTEKDREIDEFIADINRLLNRIERYPLPVLAALNGLTLGGGLELALCADFIVASEAARIGDGHARFGLLPGGGASARLPRRIGTAASKWLSFTGELIAAEAMVGCGLVQCTFPHSDFRQSVSELAEKIASRSPLGLRRMKTLIDNALNISLAQALADEQAMLRLHRSSGDRAEGLAAFTDKRTPVFRGD